MKRIRVFACLLLALTVLLLAGCGQRDEWEMALKAADLVDAVTEDAQLRADTEKILDALLAEDVSGAYAAMYAGTDYSEFMEVYEQLIVGLSEVEDYQLTAASINKTTTNGVTTTSVRYMMTAGELRFFVDVARVDGHDGLVAFYINEYVPVITTGTLGNMQGANGLQWFFLIVGLAEIAFVIYAFVDCCCHKMKKKWLWLLVIALGHLVFSLIATPEQFRVGVNVGVFLNYTRLAHYSTGGFTLQIMIPAGAIIYLICRKTLFARYTRFQQEQAMQVQPEITTDTAPQVPEITAEPSAQETEES